MTTESTDSILTISEQEECLRSRVYIRDFSSSSRSVRLQALNQIKKLSEPIAKVILRKILSQQVDPIKQIEVLGAIATCNGKFDGKREFLNDYLSHANPEIRLCALRVISKYEDEECFQTLSHATKDSLANIRKEALNLICRIYGLRALPLILHLLHDLDDSVRKSAISLCSTFECEQAIPVLITMLKDENPEIQKNVDAALRKITKESKAKTMNEWNSWLMEHSV